MWQRFTERARRVVFFAQEEAARLGENYVNTEHLLLGLVREDDSVAARILTRMGVSLAKIRSEVECQITGGEGRLGQDMQLTPRAKRVIDLAYDEARQMTNNYIGTEHLLLGLIREAGGVSARVLTKLGVELERVRREVSNLQDGNPQTSQAQSQPPEKDTVPDLELALKQLQVAQNLLNRILPKQLKGRDFLSVVDFSRDEIVSLIWGLAESLVKVFGPDHQFTHHFLSGNTLLLAIPSAFHDSPETLEMRIGLTTSMAHLGGVAVPIDAALLDNAEAASHLIDGWADGLAVYGASEEQLAVLSGMIEAPVLNAGNAAEAPFEALADFYTIRERLTSLEESRIACIGPPGPLRNSMLLTAISFQKLELAVSPGPQDQAESTYLETLHTAAQKNESSVQATATPEAAARDASVIYITPGVYEGESPLLTWERTAALRAAIKPGGIFLFGDTWLTSPFLSEEYNARLRTQQITNRLLLRKAILSLLL